MSMYSNYPNPDICRVKKHWVCEKSGCIAGCEQKNNAMDNKIDTVIDHQSLGEDLRIASLMDSAYIEQSIKTVLDFLKLLPPDRVLTQAEQSFVCEALDKVMREATK